jgi:hypothetical protein
MDGMNSLLFVLRGIGVSSPIDTLLKFLGEGRLRAIGERVLREHPRK